MLTVGLSTSVGRGLLQRAREGFAERCPNWRLQIRQVNWEDATAGLAAGDVDVALVWLPIPRQDMFNVRILATEPRWVALRDDHRLAGRDELAFDELLDEPFLALPNELALAWHRKDHRPVIRDFIDALIGS